MRLGLGLGLGGGVSVSVLVLVWGGAGPRLRVGVKAGFGVTAKGSAANAGPSWASPSHRRRHRRKPRASGLDRNAHCMCTTHQPLACGAATPHKTAVSHSLHGLQPTATACMGCSHRLQVYQVLRTSVGTVYLPRALSWRVSSSQRCITAPLQLVVGR